VGALDGAIHSLSDERSWGEFDIQEEHPLDAPPLFIVEPIPEGATS
jgi:hypothetical protein